MTTHVLLALVVVLVASRALAAVFAWFKQPAVIGEIVAGIVIGPSLLGHFVHVIPDDAIAPLGVIAQIGTARTTEPVTAVTATTPPPPPPPPSGGVMSVVTDGVDFESLKPDTLSRLRS